MRELKQSGWQTNGAVSFQTAQGNSPMGCWFVELFIVHRKDSVRGLGFQVWSEIFEIDSGPGKPLLERC
jgi:hypothetical protein